MMEQRIMANKFIVTVVLLVATSTPSASFGTGGSVALTDKEINDVLSAIRIVESNDNSDAVGDNGNAIGVYQIWRSYHKDAVEFSNIGGNYRDCFDPHYADLIIRAYMQRYAVRRRVGRPVTQQDIARIHNGGPNGYKKSSTNKYWDKVKKELKVNNK